MHGPTENSRHTAWSSAAKVLAPPDLQEGRAGLPGSGVHWREASAVSCLRWVEGDRRPAGDGEQGAAGLSRVICGEQCGPHNSLI